MLHFEIGTSILSLLYLKSKYSLTLYNVEIHYRMILTLKETLFYFEVLISRSPVN